MAVLELNDIQGNILRGYGFPAGVYSFLSVPDATRGRRLLREILPRVTDARRWRSRPAVAANVAVTFAGLEALGVDLPVLASLPKAYAEPMRERAPRELGDTGPSAPGCWDEGLGTGQAHVLVMLAADAGSARGTAGDAQTLSGPLADAVAWLDERLRRHRAVCVHRQAVAALANQREHFGYADGFGQPAVEGMPRNWPGQGTPQHHTRGWRDVKPGEFILGAPNEDGDCVGGEDAWLLRNGSYMVYRKLRQDVALFRRQVAAAAQRYGGATGTSLSPEAGFELIAAKLVGRWRDGIALALDRRLDRGGGLERRAHRHVDNDFRYGDDPHGFACPRGAHIRRANPRDMAGADGTGARRHRIIRRGMPYGEPYPDGEEAQARDDGDRGLIFICFNADFERQFELIQAQWCDDGNAFGLGDDQDPLLGRGRGKFTVEGQPPFLLDSRPDLVLTRGCEYLLMPGLGALHRLAAPRSPEEGDLERVPAGEDEATARVVELVRREMRRHWASSRPVRRGQHPKSHGCVEARFVVPDDVPADLRHGLFAQPGTYEAWVRFSGSHATLQSDAKRDAHGMSVKVLGVMGEKVLQAERWATTQDFLMVNHDSFFSRDAVEYAAFAETVTATGSPGAAGVWLKLRILAFFLTRGRLRGLRHLLAVVNQTVANPLAVRYWSQTPYALGPHAVKYSARPLTPAALLPGAPRTWDGLLDALAASLEPADAEFTFELLVQRQADPRRMPVEDPTVTWSERESRFRRVATIEIRSQDVRDQRRRNWAERLVFTPWHTRWDLMPLGGINRVRRAVYQASSDLRHELNGVPHREPEGTVPEHAG